MYVKHMKKEGKALYSTYVYHYVIFLDGRNVCDMDKTIKPNYDIFARRGLSNAINSWMFEPEKHPEIFVGEDGFLRVVRLGLRMIISKIIKANTGRNYYRVGIYKIIEGMIQDSLLSFNPHFDQHINPSNKTRYIVDLDQVFPDEELTEKLKKVVSERAPPKQAPLFIKRESVKREKNFNLPH